MPVYLCVLCARKGVQVRGCRSPRGFVRHMREVHQLAISEYEILLLERRGDAALARKAGKAKQR